MLLHYHAVLELQRNITPDVFLSQSKNNLLDTKHVTFLEFASRIGFDRKVSC